MAILNQPIVANPENPVVSGIVGAVASIAQSMARARAIEEQRRLREQERQDRLAANAEDRRRWEVGQARDQARYTDQHARIADEQAYARQRNAVADRAARLKAIAEGAAMPRSPDMEEMGIATQRETKIAQAAQLARQEEARRLFVGMNDEAQRHAREAGTARDALGQPIGYDGAKAIKAYAAWWDQTKKTLPPGLRSMIDEVGQGEARKAMAGMPGARFDPMDMPQAFSMPGMVDNGTSPPAQAAAPVSSAPSSSGGSFWTIQRSGAPGGPKTLGDILGGRWYGQGDYADAQAAPSAGSAPQAPVSPARGVTMGSQLPSVSSGALSGIAVDGMPSPDAGPGPRSVQWRTFSPADVEQFARINRLTPEAARAVLTARAERAGMQASFATE
jgi:hypothetical protein